jgi:lipopolysaccharide assembly outer membrane protein LptD (OstA)
MMAEKGGRGSRQTASGESVTLEHCDAELVKGDQVVMRQASAQTVDAGDLRIKQGAALRIQADEVEMTQGGALLVSCGKAGMEASRAGLVVSAGDVEMDQSAAKIVLAKGGVSMDQSAVLLAAGQTVRVEKSSSFMVLAGKVEGSIETRFGPRESLIFGAAAGFAAGLTLALFRLVSSGER